MLKRQTAFSMPHHASPPSPLTTRVRMGLVQHTDTGAGPALLALHGGMGGYDQSWLLARALIADLTPYRVLALSRPGYLGTAQSLGRTPDAQADLYAELLDALGIEKALVAAVSAGGPSAIQFALRHPGRCAGLVLVSTATGPLETAPAFLKRLQKMVWINRVPGLVALMRRRLMENPLSGATRSIGDPDLAARTLAHPIAGPLFLATQRSSLSQVSRRLPGTLVDTKYFQAMPIQSFRSATQRSWSMRPHMLAGSFWRAAATWRCLAILMKCAPALWISQVIAADNDLNPRSVVRPLAVRLPSQGNCVHE